MNILNNILCYEKLKSHALINIEINIFYKFNHKSDVIWCRLYNITFAIFIILIKF